MSVYDLKKIIQISGLFYWFCSGIVGAQVYHIDISGTIDLGLPPYIERVIKEAEAADARLLLLEVSTLGGRVDAAIQIKDLLLNSKVKTAAFVNKRAISAGALITLSCEKIGMVPGSSIGAATVVSGGGEKAPEKMISYFRAEMGATAEHYGRNRMIAEGMVDEDVVVKGLSEKGKLITLTAEDAIEWQMADETAPTLAVFLDRLGLGKEEIIYSEVNWAEQVVRFLTHPIVSSLLLTLGFLGILFELNSPGWGIGGTIGATCLVLFFGSHYIVKLAGVWEVLIFMIGIILLTLELFVIPGFGIAGFAGIVLILAGAYLSLLGELEMITSVDLSSAAIRLGMAVFLTLLLAILIFRYAPRMSIWKRITLEPEQKSSEGYVASVDYRGYIGRTGIALTPLRPSGIGQFGDERLDIVSEGAFVNEGVSIKITHVEGYRLVVRVDKDAGAGQPG